MLILPKDSRLNRYCISTMLLGTLFAIFFWSYMNCKSFEITEKKKSNRIGATFANKENLYVTTYGFWVISLCTTARFRMFYKCHRQHAFCTIHCVASLYYGYSLASSLQQEEKKKHWISVAATWKWKSSNNWKFFTFAVGNKNF